MADKTLLITFGCSWTLGVGVSYEPGMTKEEFNQTAWDPTVCNQLSWRGVLSRRYNLTNINFSAGGSSNQRQFRLAQEFFPSDKFKKLQKQHDRIVVLWGITSTARNEVYSVDDNNVNNIFYHEENNKISKFLLLNCYNHPYEIAVLRRQMIHWEHYFSLLNIENYWFDTLNTHNYCVNDFKFFSNFPNKEQYQTTAGQGWPNFENFYLGNFNGVPDQAMQEITSTYNNILPPRNILDHDMSARDLMSWLCLQSDIKDFDDSYHLSRWEVDGGRIEHLKLKKIVNPISLHPTKDAHEKLAQYFSERIKFN